MDWIAVKTGAEEEEKRRKGLKFHTSHRATHTSNIAWNSSRDDGNNKNPIISQLGRGEESVQKWRLTDGSQPSQRDMY